MSGPRTSSRGSRWRHRCCRALERGQPHAVPTGGAFAGSGALGFEALSRGAKEVIFLEKHAKAAFQLKDNLKQLDARNAQVWAGDALMWLDQNPEPYDLVFLDPPFGKDLLQPALNKLTLLPGALVYIEHEASLEPEFPAHWEELKNKGTKEFVFRLFEVGETA